MFASGRHCWAFLAGSTLLMALPTGTVAVPAAVSASDDQLLRQADSLRTSNHAEFVQLIKRLDGKAKELSPSQRMYLRYLQAWELGYQGNYEIATPRLNAVITESSDATLRFRAGTTLVNMLSIGAHYERAFVRTSELLEQLPHITDRDARIQALGVASLLYNDAGQYDLGLNYANQMLGENPTGGGDCKGKFLQAQAFYESGAFSMFGSHVDAAVAACNRAAEPIFTNTLRFYVASFDIRRGQPAAAIALLQKHYANVQRIGYPELISEFNAVLAQAYWNQGRMALATRYASATVDGAARREFTKSFAAAYQLLYRISKGQGDFPSALAYHEKYLAADKGYLNEVSAKAIAYQTVRQQVLAKKLQVETLSKQNQILTLQQSLAKKASETSHLYIFVLLMVLAFIALWTYRIKRSQLRFMKLARRDGLTGIFNRQHFVSEAELQLQYCRKSSRDACLVLIDLDHFKIVNDTHGHAVGDRVLRRAVQACQAHLRSTDIFGRLGGEEFGILLPECTLAQVVARTEQIRIAIATVATGEDAPGIPISASFGVSMTGQSGYGLRQLLIHADEALYRSKREGRNRVSVSDISQPALRTV